MGKTRRINRLIILPLSAVVILGLTGCFGVNSKFKKVRDVVLDHHQLSYKVETEFGVGGFWLSIARRIVAMSDDPDAREAKVFLDSISSVQVGSYRLEESLVKSGKADYESVNSFIGYMNGQSYDSLVRNYYSDGFSLILVGWGNSSSRKVREVLIVNLTESELSIVQVRGDIDEMVEFIAREREVPQVEEVTDGGGV